MTQGVRMLKLWRISNRLVVVGLMCLLVLLGSYGRAGSGTKQVVSGKSNPVLKWKYSLGESRVDTNPAVAGGVVYVATNRYVQALNVSTGKSKWKVETPGYAVSSPTVGDGLLFLGTTSFRDIDSRTGRVTAYALNAQTGNIEWQHTLSNDRSEYSSNPVVADGLIYFGTGWSDWSCCEERGNGGHLVALDEKSGEPMWQVDTKEDYGSGGSPTTSFGVANGMLYVGNSWGGPYQQEKRIRALDARTGREAWKVPSGANFPLVAPDGSLYTVVKWEMVKYDGKTGQQMWRWEPDLDKT